MILQIDKFWTHCFFIMKIYGEMGHIGLNFHTLRACFFFRFFCTCLELKHFKTWNCVQFAIDWTKTCFVLNFFSPLFAYEMLAAAFIYIFQVIIIYINSSFHSRAIRFTHSFHKLGSSVFFSSLDFITYYLPLFLFCLVILSMYLFLNSW